MNPNSCQTWLLRSRHLWQQEGLRVKRDFSPRRVSAPENTSLETAAKRLFPRAYGDRYSITVLEQLKAWEAFRMLNILRRKNPTMPRGDVTPAGCP